MRHEKMSSHIDTVMIEAYSAQLLDAGADASIERHLDGCAKCRAAVATACARGDVAALGPDRLRTIWTTVSDKLDPPPVATALRRRFFLGTGGERVRPLLARFAIPTGRLVLWARLALVTAVAVVALPALQHVGSVALPGGGNVDSVVVDHPAGNARNALHDISPQFPCARAEVPFTLSWGLRWLTRLVFTVADGSAARSFSDPHQQLAEFAAPPIEGAISAFADELRVVTSTK